MLIPVRETPRSKSGKADKVTRVSTWHVLTISRQ
jgi:hypothetical protein